MSRRVTMLQVWREELSRQFLAEGYDQGFKEGLMAAIIDLLNIRFQAIPPSLVETMEACDKAELRRILAEAETVTDLDQLISTFGKSGGSRKKGRVIASTSR